MAWYDGLAGILAIIFLWIFDTLLIRVWIRLRAKKKWNKCKKTYPYFSGNIIQKLFLHGLRGAIDTTIIVLTYIFNISSFLGVLMGIWGIICPKNIIVEYIFRGILGVWLINSICKDLVLYYSPPEF